MTTGETLERRRVDVDCRAGTGPVELSMDLVGFPGDELTHDYRSEAMMFEPLAEVPEELLRWLKWLKWLKVRAGQDPAIRRLPA